MSKREIDALDKDIIKLLQADGRKPYTEIAHMLGVSEGTIRTRVNKLLEDKVIEFVVHANPAKLGLHTQAIIGLSTVLGKQESIAKALSAYKEVRFIAMTSGTFDMILQVYLESNEKLIEFINQHLPEIEGIKRAEVFIELKNFKDSFEFVQ